MFVVVETWKLETDDRQSAAGWLPNIHATDRGPFISISTVKPASHSSALVKSRLLAFGIWRLAFGVWRFCRRNLIRSRRVGIKNAGPKEFLAQIRTL